jgi:deoxycytidylate deaminase
VFVRGRDDQFLVAFVHPCSFCSKQIGEQGVSPVPLTSEKWSVVLWIPLPSVRAA